MRSLKAAAIIVNVSCDRYDVTVIEEELIVVDVKRTVSALKMTHFTFI